MGLVEKVYCPTSFWMEQTQECFIFNSIQTKYQGSIVTCFYLFLNKQVNLNLMTFEDTE